MRTNFQQVVNESRISKNIDLPPEQKKLLPPPKILSEVYVIGKRFCVDIEDHLGQKWTIVSVKRTKLRQKLRYFKTLPREVIWSLIPRMEPQVSQEAKPPVETPADPVAKPAKVKKTKKVEEKPAAPEPKPLSRLMQRMKQNKAE